ncbi:MAG: PorV/PorQ family protein [Chitinivibrionales bacterium]|nr:PorV/PorQ family protein [Chitinivibrionales bacterium]MBD3357310.1 PorV/PorQ family protein [Chitinivibrionales bacterium]
MKCVSKVASTIIISLLLHSTARADVGQSAVITLLFPPGARATGLAEAFVAVSDDANATFFNPAGLGQSPLANAWHAFPLEDGIRPTTVTSKKNQSFGARNRIWVGTNKGIYKYSGGSWTTYETYLIEVGDDLEEIAERFLNTEDQEELARAVRLIKRENGIDQKKAQHLRSILTDAAPDLTDDKTQEIIDAILALEEREQNLAGAYGVLATRLDTTLADSLDGKAAEVFEMDDIRFADLVELRVPFSIAVRDSITALRLDLSDRLWVGTQNGLWRYDGASWMYYTTLSGLPSDHITSLAVGPHSEIAVGTDAGVAILDDGIWTAYDDRHLPDLTITSIAFAEPGVLYVGTRQGLARKKEKQWTVFDTTNGLLSPHVSALMYDSQRSLWIGGENGITIYDKTSWKRYKFPDSKIHSFAELDEGKVWIGTNRGAITYREGRQKTGRDGKSAQPPPLWKFYHSKNALEGTAVHDVSVQGKDAWLITDKAVNQYDHADMQFQVFYERLLPAFQIPDLWHIYLAGVIPTNDWGTIGATVNYINFGEIEITDEEGAVEPVTTHSWEGVFGLSYGLPIKEDLSLGLNLKYVHSALAPEYGEGDEGIGRTFAVDAALLKRNLLVEGLSLGLNVQNMGPPIYYVSRDDADPLPFNIKFGLAYKVVSTPLVQLQVITDLNREIVKNSFTGRPDPFWEAFYTDLIKMKEDQTYWEKFNEELREVIAHVGVEFWYANFLALRLGYMHDDIGYRKEISIGLGLSYGNLSFDGSYIHSPKEMSVARHGQWRISLLLKI